MLRVEGLNVFYDELQALIDVTIQLQEGDFLAIIGSNGAGKTTLLRTISGLVRVRSGEILFRNKPISRETTDLICADGIIHVPEGRKLFPQMTVCENLEMGAYLPEAHALLGKRIADVYRLFPRLEERRKQNAETLSGGEQQMLAIGRALMAGPRLLMLDEPSMGLSPKFASEVYGILDRLHQGGLTILLVSQDVLQALKIADRAYVLENGRVVMEGLARELLGSSKIKESYLGI
jgi:branched-chain amino acid transport system ATP-binding protein